MHGIKQGDISGSVVSMLVFVFLPIMQLAHFHGASSGATKVIKICSDNPQDLETHINVYEWWSYPLMLARKSLFYPFKGRLEYYTN